MPKPLILIIEDDPKLAAIYQMSLQQAGFDTALDMNGNQYLPLVATVCPAVIILDLHMPFASGVDILQEIRGNPRLADIPVIVTTAALVLVKSLRGQAQEILMKPVSTARLRETVLRLCPGM
jgi:two-component system response regulator BaeR